MSSSDHHDPHPTTHPTPLQFAHPYPASSDRHATHHTAVRAVAREANFQQTSGSSGAAVALGLAGYVLALPVAAVALTAVTAVMMI